MTIKTVLRSNHPEYIRLMRKGDQESELGSMAASDGHNEEAKVHFSRAKEFWAAASFFVEEK